MYKILSTPHRAKEGVFQSVADDFKWAVIAEPWYGIPLAKSITKDKDEVFYGRAFQTKEDREFSALKRMKLLLHNGTHALLSYLGYLKGYSYFYQLTKERELLRRILCPVFKDSIKRGVRGFLELRDFIDEIGSEYIEVYFEVNNTLLTGYPEERIRILNKRIKKVLSV